MKIKNKFRRDGIIPKLKTSAYPSQMVFFDTETSPIIKDNGQEYQSLKLGVARYIKLSPKGKIIKDESIVFRNNRTFIRFISQFMRPKTKIYLFAHNIAFDIMVLDLAQYFLEIGVETRPPIQNNAMFLWRVKTARGTLEFINTGNYVLRPLADIGEDLGIPKLAIDFGDVTDDELITYCARDVEILKVFIFKMVQWLRDNNLGSFKSTIASLAFSVYRYKFMNIPIGIHNDGLALKIERKGYKGGRTEVHQMGNFNSVIYGYYDINSMYPFVMKDENLPTKYLGYEHQPTLSTIKEYMKDYYIIADVTITTDKPFFPIKFNPNYHTIENTNIDPTTGKLIFPIGTINSVLHHDELAYAIEENMPIEIHGFTYYKRGKIFSEYVDFFTKMKIQADEVNNKTDRLFAKLMLNSLYGKWGQKFKDTVYVGNVVTQFDSNCTIIDKNGNEIATQTIWLGRVYHAITNGEATYSFPAIAGAITAKARMLLWSYMERLGIENIFYCDTDSIITNDVGWDILKDEIHPTKLGALALEKASNNLIIRGAKDYQFGDGRVIKGVPKNAKLVKPNSYEYLQFEGFKTWVNRGASGSPRTWTQTKTKKSSYDKGIVQPNGKVKPLEVTTIARWALWSPKQSKK